VSNKDDFMLLFPPVHDVLYCLQTGDKLE